MRKRKNGKDTKYLKERLEKAFKEHEQVRKKYLETLDKANKKLENCNCCIIEHLEQISP